MAAFTLTDWAIIAALKEAHTRGVPFVFYSIRVSVKPTPSWLK
jgi:hypothetical protein